MFRQSKQLDSSAEDIQAKPHSMQKERKWVTSCSYLGLKLNETEIHSPVLLHYLQTSLDGSKNPFLKIDWVFFHLFHCTFGCSSRM